jgi:hypothetical protein
VAGSMVLDEPASRTGRAQCRTCWTWPSHRPRSGRASRDATWAWTVGGQLLVIMIKPPTDQPTSAIPNLDRLGIASNVLAR